MVPRPRMKPKFSIPLLENEEQVFERLKTLLRSDQCPVNGQVLKKHAFIQFPKADRSLLSPYLNLSLRKNKSGTLELVGRFSPHPHVFTGFIAINGVIAMMGLSGLVFGWAKSLIGEPATMMWTAPASVLLIAFLFGASIIAQGLTADEMYTLRKVVDCAVENCHSEPASSDPEEPQPRR